MAHASVETLGSILSRGMFEIPMYQRPYSWGKDEIETFLEDISLLGENESHLFGMVVLSPSLSNVGGSNIYQIIDGQQRITTSLLALAICHDFLTDWSFRESFQSSRELREFSDTILSELKTYLFDRRSSRAKLVTKNENDIERCVLKCLLTPPSYLDRTEFIRASEELDRYDQLPTNERSTTQLKQNILAQWDQRSVKAKKAFKNHALIASYIQTKSGDLGDEGMVRYIDVFTTKIIKNLQCVQFVVDSEYNAFKLFETMNDRGLGISAMDLVKNLGLRYVHPTNGGDDQAQQFFLSKWKQIFEVNLPSGHLLFLRYANNARRDFRKASEIYRVYSESVFTSIDSVKGEMTALEGLSELFRDSWFPDRRRPSDPFQVEIGLLQSTKTQQWLVIALSTLHLKRQIESVYDDKIRTILRLVYKLIFIQLVKDLGSNQFEKLFPAWALRIYSSISDRGQINSVLDDIIAQCNAKIIDLGELEVSDLASRRFEKNDVAKSACYAVHLISGRLHGHEISLSLQLEHIYPQTPGEGAWTLFNDLNDDAKNKLTYSLGNFILLDQSLNPSIGNSDFATKKEAYRENRVVDQLYPTGSENSITEIAEFTPETINARSMDMAKVLIQCLSEFCNA